METLQSALEVYHNDALREISRTLGVRDAKPGISRKAALIPEVARTIMHNVRSKPYIASLSPAERALMGVVLHESRAVLISELVLPMVLSGTVSIEGLPATSALPQFGDVLLSLLCRGLVINAKDLSGGDPLRTFERVDKVGLAQEVRAALSERELPYPASRFDLLSAPDPVQIQAGDFESATRQLFFLWADIRQQPLARLKSGGLGKRDLRRLATHLGLGADDKSSEWVEKLSDMLSALKLLKVESEEYRAVESDAVTLFWDSRPAAMLREILALYLSLETALPVDAQVFPALLRYPSLSLQSYSYMRSRVVDALKGFRTPTWVPFVVFLSLFDAEVGSLLIDDRTRLFLYGEVRWSGEQRIRALDATLLRVEREVLLAILEELQALGMVDLGFSGDGTRLPVALRLSPIALAVLENRTMPPRPAGGQVIAQPDFQVLAMGPVPLGVLIGLERVAMRESLTPSVVTYRLRREQAYAAFRRGETQQSISAFITEITDQPLPQNVTRTLQEWQEQYDRIELWRAVAIVETDSDELMTALLQDPQVGRLMTRMDGRIAWVRAPDLTVVEKRLWDLEQLAAYSVGPEADLPNSLKWDGDALVPRQRLPSLFVSATLRRVATEDHGVWRLTPQSVRGGVAAGMQVAEITQAIEQMTGVKTSSEWRRQIKAWGKHYGDAALASVVLLKFESDTALADLRRDEPRLGRWLRPLAGAEGIAIVDGKVLDEALRLLTELGVSVTREKWW